MRLQGPEQVAPLANSIYTRYVGVEGVKEATYQSWIFDPENRIIKLKPEQVHTWAWD